MNDLTVSNIERQNVLNNRYALQTIQENLEVNGLRFHEQLLFTTKMVADFYEVDERTIKRYVQEYGDELRANGYFLSQGNSLKEIRLHFDGDINVPNKVRKLGIFTFRAFLNIGMLLTGALIFDLLGLRWILSKSLNLCYISDINDYNLIWMILNFSGNLS